MDNLQNAELVKLILLLGGIAGALAAITALIVKIVKTVKKIIKYFKTLRESIDMLLKHDKEQYKSILKLTIVNEALPISERALAAKNYFALGGNGDIKKYYKAQIEPYDHVKGDKENETSGQTV